MNSPHRRHRTLPGRATRAVLLLLASGCAQTPEPRPEEATEREPVPASTTTIAAGSHSAVAEPDARIARTPAQWAALWSEHAAAQLPASSPPPVDFETEMVVAVFLGSRPSAGYALEILGCERTADALVVRAREIRPAPDRARATVVTTPFHFVRVPRASDVRLELEPD